MNYAPAFSRITLQALLKYIGLLLAAATILAELFMALTQTQSPLWIITWIGVVFGLIIVVLWAVPSPQNEPATSPPYTPYAPSYAPHSPTYLDLSQPQPFPSSPPEPAPGSPPEKYQYERSVLCFTFAKGNESVARTQDAFDLDNNLRRYAVTDGVSRSFLPSHWARILSTHFVHYGQGIENEALFPEWLHECNNEWNQWAKQWIDRADQRRKEQRLINSTDWEQYITLGAQATLVGCTLSPVSKHDYHIQVTAIGDANFFRVRHSHNGTWEYVAYPYTDPAAFGTTPNALATAAVASSKSIQRTWNWINTQAFNGQKGDYVLLATDAIAKWLLQQLQFGQQDWLCLLDPNTTSSDLRRQIFMERATGKLEDDDVTILVVPL